MRPLLVVVAAAALATLLCGPRAARADDLADEADLHFRIAAERYQAKDYLGALEHFLASNRLVPNRNVVFNIARTYEQLKQYADAHRSYVQALDAETDKAAKKRIEEAIARLAPNVAVLQITSEPPGATIYIDRRDLGPRGSTPRLLAFPPGKYKVLVELEGYEPAEAGPVTARVGHEVPVALKLQRILGDLRAEGGPAGTMVSVDDEAAAPQGPLPLDLQLPPGRHTLFFKKDGYKVDRQDVEVKARATARVRANLTPITGKLVVNVDETESLIEIDGKPFGFAPAVLDVPVGRRKVRVSHPGFRAVERVVEISAKGQVQLELELRAVEEVTAASRVTEDVVDAPSSVTILSAQELRAFGYPNVAEALRGVRGIYVSDDRSYATAGIRGLGRLGDYGNRVLVLLDGMPTNDNWIGSSFMSYDARTDIEDLERIVIVRGAGSVLYGTGAVLGVINLVPRGRESREGVDLGVSTAEYGIGRARAAGTARFGEDSGVWLSAAGARAMGRDFYFAEFDQPAAGTDGQARGLDGFDGGTVTGRGWWGDLNAQWLWHTRTKQLATGAYDSLFTDPRLELTDTHGLFELRHEPQLSEHVQLLSRAFVRRYEFRDAVPYAPAEGGLAQEEYDGTWGGLEERIVLTLSKGLQLTLGGEGQLHFEVRQRAADQDAVYLDRSDPYEIGAGYAVVDARPADWMRVSAGARVDAYSTFGSSVNPRLALIFHPYEAGTFKLLGGKAFRAPSVYELYYNDDGVTQIPSPDLGPETLYSGELEYSHRFGRAWTAVVAGFGSYIEDLIVSVGDGTSESPIAYENSTAPIVTVGGELELRRDWRHGSMLGASYSVQRSRYTDDTGTLREVPNSPEHLASLKGAVPLFSRNVTLASKLSFEGPRFDRHELGGDPAQTRTDPALVWDVIVSGQSVRQEVRWAVGIYNAIDWRYEAPVSAEYRQATIPQAGRTLLASVTLSL